MRPSSQNQPSEEFQFSQKWVCFPLVNEAAGKADAIVEKNKILSMCFLIYMIFQNIQYIY